MKEFLVAILSLVALNVHAQFNDSWIISADNIQPNNYYGETVANGMLGIVSSSNPFKVKDIVLNGAFDQYGRGRVSNILKVFNFTNMYMEIDGRRIEHFDQVSNMQQVLDMKNASLTTTLSVGDKAQIQYTYYALRQLPFSALVDVTITAKNDVEIMPCSVMEAPDMLKDVENYYNQIDRPHALISLLTSAAKSPTGKLLIAASNSFILDELQGNQPALVHEMWDNGLHLLKFRKKLKKGEVYHFAIVGSVMTSAQHEDPLNEVERLTMYAALQGSQQLIAQHKDAWSELWKSDIIVDGDAQVQQEVRSMMYHLYSFVREGSGYGVSPMGLSGLGYNGHSFWDTEIWMYPALLLLHPEMARSLLDYRFNRLSAARQNAMEHGYKGAMFPWESAATGNEETPVWALSGPFEHHITADIGIAAWNYFCVTQDTVWLREKGWQLIKETADFWLSRVQKDRQGNYNINNVVAADEWAENIDNNAYTNAAAKANLQYAKQAATLLKFPVDSQWEIVEQHIPILKMSNGVTQEHASYHGEKIKQADVNLLAYPLKEITDKTQIKKDLDYYEPRVGDGPAMTHAIFAILYAQLQIPEKALTSFTNGYRANFLPPFSVIAETAGGTNPYFATGAGGMLQAMLNGFGGLDITKEGIKQLPTKLPKGWSSLTLTGIGVQNQTFKVVNK
ncbi:MULTISPECIES: glycoside hydrolase family 65 protein [Chitinophagaceae]